MKTLALKVLIVDDDPEIRDLVRAYLTDEGLIVEEAGDGDALRASIGKSVPDLILLDLKLPGEDGLTLAREIRQDHPNIGIVIISGKNDVIDRVAGLEVGADDYIIKPFHLRELLARIRSVLRRNENGAVEPMSAPAQAAGTEPRKIFRFQGWMLDCDERTLMAPDDRPIELTGGEFDLLVAFVTHPNRALTRDQLLDYTYNSEADSYDRSIDVQVGRLRRKIEPDPKRPALIKTVRNVGYMFCGT